MNLYIRGAGLLGLVLLLLPVSAASCEGGAKGAIEVIEHEKVPESALQKIAADMHISSDSLPGLVKKVPESTVEHDVKSETNGLDAETANKDIAAACKLTDNLPGKESIDSNLQVDDTVTSIEQSLRDARESPDVSVICHTADALETLNG